MSLIRVSNDLCDTISNIIYCESDQTMLVVLDNNSSEFWFPTMKITIDSCWNKESQRDLDDMFGINIVQPTKILRYHRIYVPISEKSYIHSIMFEIKINNEQKRKNKIATGKYKGKFRWVNQTELTKLQNNSDLKSPEILDYYFLIKSNSTSYSTLPMEFINSGNLIETTRNIFISEKNTIYEQVIDAAGFEQSIQEQLYKDFLLICFPCNLMSYQNFNKFISTIGWPKEEIISLFRAADINLRNAISFREFLYILAICEPSTNHSGVYAKLRCQYIFRYYDNDKNNLLNYDEIKNIILAMKKVRKQPLDQIKTNKEVSDCYKTMGYPESHSITLSEFIRVVDDLKFRGTSQLLRSPISIVKIMRDLNIASQLEKENKNKTIITNKQTAAPPKSNYTSANRNIVTTYTKKTEYDLAIHTIKIKKNGEAIFVEQLSKVDIAITPSSVRQLVVSDTRSKISIDQFQQNSVTNELLKGLRYLSQINSKLPCYIKPDQFKYNWGQLDPVTLANHLINICTQIKLIFKKEPRLLDLSSPIYILGDLHGNFGDLLNFEKVFWHLGPGLCPCNILFLGDYVDRGLYSVEVIGYLFCYKLQNPQKLKMIRGNHEIKRIQLQWTFEKECKLKFGNYVGTNVFNAVNDAFNAMPLAAVIDGRIFCCHGGIPPPWLCPVVSAINEIPINLNDPQDQSALAWDLMWNDPVRTKHLNEKTALELLTNDGFANNARRGTAHVFSVEALEKFLQINGFTHLIRAHEVVEVGFYLQQKGKLLTIFSSSKYCGTQNEAALIMADQERLRIFRLETE